MMLEPVSTSNERRGALFRKMDFRAKLVLMIVLSILALLWENPILGGVLTLSVIIFFLYVGVKPLYFRQVLTLMAPFYLFILITQGFFADDLIYARTGQDFITPLFIIPNHWWLVGGATFSLEGVLYGLNVIFKTLTMSIIFPLGMLTTDINAMIVSMVKARVPYKLVFVFSSTLRFFPLLFAEIQSITEAQKLRGLAIENMGVFKRMSVYAKIAVPLILSAMVKSQTLELALQTRAFSGNSKRTYLHDSQMQTTDYLVIVIAGIMLISAAIAYFAFDFGRWSGPI
jgi:energy-coupling factor transport system permease protein